MKTCVRTGTCEQSTHPRSVKQGEILCTLLCTEGCEQSRAVESSGGHGVEWTGSWGWARWGGALRLLGGEEVLALLGDLHFEDK